MYFYRVWRGFGLYFESIRMTIEAHAFRAFYLCHFNTKRYFRTRYTDIGSLGVCVQVVTGDISIPNGFTRNTTK